MKTMSTSGAEVPRYVRHFERNRPISACYAVRFPSSSWQHDDVNGSPADPGVAVYQGRRAADVAVGWCSGAAVDVDRSRVRSPAWTRLRTTTLGKLFTPVCLDARRQSSSLYRVVMPDPVGCDVAVGARRPYRPPRPARGQFD